MLLVAAGRATNVEDVGLETTTAEVERGHRQGRRPHAHPRAAPVRDRRHRGRAHARPHRRPRGHRRRPHDRRRPGRPPDGLREAAPGDLLPARDRLVGLTEQQCEERGLPVKIGKVPFKAIAKALIGGEYEASPRSSEQGDRRDAGHPPDRPARHGPDRGGVVAFEPRGDAVGDRRLHPPAPDALRGPGRGRDGGRRPLHQLLSPVGRPERMTAREGRNHSEPRSGCRTRTCRDVRLVALARAVDERMWILNRAGRIPFVISGQGHEGAQVGIAWPLQKGHDWIAPFYRSIATCLTFGMSPRDLMIAQYATASDPSSGGRQMPGHYGSHEHNLVSVSSPVATQILHAVGIALAAKIRRTDQVAMAVMGEEQQPGRRPRGAQLRGDPQAAVRVHRREQRLRDQRAGREAGRRSRTSRSAHRATGSRGVVSTAPTCWPATRPAARRWTGRVRRGPDAHRGQGHPPDRPLVGRPADEVPLRGGPGGGPGPGPAADLPRAAPRRPAS